VNVCRLVSAAALVLMLSACAATGPKMAEVKSSIPALKASEGRIYFYRADSMFGAAIQPTIKLNGQDVGSSKPGGFFFVDAAPGPKEVSTETEVEKKLTFALSPGETRYVKTRVGFGVIAGRVYPELVDKAVGEGEIAQASYIGKPLR